MPEQLKELEDLRGMGHEGVLVTLINIRHDIADVRADLKSTDEKNAAKIRELETKAEARQERTNTEIARSRDFESKTAGQFGVLKGVGGSFGALFIAVLGWAASQIWAHSVALESLPDFKNRVTAIEGTEVKVQGTDASLSGRVDKLETDMTKKKDK